MVEGVIQTEKEAHPPDQQQLFIARARLYQSAKYDYDNQNSTDEESEGSDHLIHRAKTAVVYRPSSPTNSFLVDEEVVDLLSTHADASETVRRQEDDYISRSATKGKPPGAVETRVSFYSHSSHEDIQEDCGSDKGVLLE